ncbi:MAG: hypothetical protein UT34_C0001G0178 [candidate division WS6 bacterium GW2011_GWF2_39_15]|uniref:Uncharacterized protein n=1 Tax=candidate division WS6 bacterium GW2011_GWF2_39_15 TaxID=1619100 RepID=A0A0G0MSM2_9BACT|nr:MAG: hypothetical protein UT34_C0001G0178 [candidate division WS6 bacterium GW2011_GWF2_39_15]
MILKVTSIRFLAYADEKERSLEPAMAGIKIPLLQEHVQAYKSGFIPDLSQEMTLLESELGKFNVNFGLNHGGPHYDKGYQLAQNPKDAVFDIYSGTDNGIIGNIHLQIEGYEPITSSS